MSTNEHNRKPSVEERAAHDDAITLSRCPLCAGGGLVSPEIANAFEKLAEQAAEHR